MDKYYAGIGSRETPEDTLALMADLAEALAMAGYCLRSGAADGADSAFEAGVVRAGGLAEVYLPWQGFNGHASPLYGVTEPALALAEKVHPRWERLGEGPRKLHGRNCYQVLGKELTSPVEFLLCWTQDGCESVRTRTSSTGGTATAIVLAERKGVPRFNLKNLESALRLKGYLGERGISVPQSLEELASRPRAPQQISLL